MTPELTVLTLSALLAAVQFVLYDVLANRELGITYMLSSRDEDRLSTLSERGARLRRAYNNHIEWLVPFTVAVLVIETSDQNSGFTATCAWLYLLARVAYVPAYALGLNPWRSVIWAVGFLANMLMLLAALI